MGKKTIYGILSGLFWGFLTSLLSGVIQISPIGCLVAPGLLAIVGVRAGVAGLVLVETGYLAGSLLLLGAPGLAVFVQCSLPAIALTVSAQKLSRFETLALTCGGSLAGYWLSRALMMPLTGLDLIAATYAAPVELAKSMRTYLEGILVTSLADPENARIFAQNMDSYESFAAMIAPALSILIAMATGLIAVLLVSRSVRRSAKPGFVLPPFSRWHLPRSFSGALAVMLIVSYFGAQSGWQNFESVLLCVELIFFVSYGLLGLSVIDALLRFAKVSKGQRIFAVVGLLVISVGYLPLLAGLFDTLFSIRLRLNPPSDPSV